uniref:COesterase domain-containing protein n=1 Tax=Angiostrongylus cantonensis TaxID=6313 RepID=A0A0K0DRF0_ANGCA
LGQTCTDLIDLVDAENITPVFKRGAALLDYPVSDVYSGALENMCRTSDIDAVPLIHHVRVFHEDGQTLGSYSQVHGFWKRPTPLREDLDVSPDKHRNKIDLDVFFSVKSHEEPKYSNHLYMNRGLSDEERPVFLSADNLERDQMPVGFSVSISARQPDDRISPEQFSSPLRELSSDKRYLRDHSRHRLSPHTWTTVRERTEVTYVRKVRVERSLSPRTPTRSNFIRRVPYKPNAEFSNGAYSCRSTNFDERVMVHHPIYPPNEPLYRSVTQSGDSPNGRYRSYSPVREVAAFDRTERSEEIFTVGTPFIMGQVEHDGKGCAYLRYQKRLNDLPMIEEGAIECRRATVRAGLRDMDAVRLVQDEEDLERRQRPIRRARQRIRSYCTML